MNRVYRGEDNGYRPGMEGRWEGARDERDWDERMRTRGRHEIDEDWRDRGHGYRDYRGYSLGEGRFAEGRSRFGEGRFSENRFSEGRYGRDWGERWRDERAGHFFDRVKRKLTGPKNYQRSDERIREDLCDRLAYSDWIDTSDVEVQVSGGDVTLIGTVRERYVKHYIEDIADSILGVKDVHNQLRIDREPEKAETSASGRGTRERTPRA